MDIWTERLEHAHLPLVERWAARGAGLITPNDLPADQRALEEWFEKGAAEPGRLDCLALVYETPVGIAGLRQYDCRGDTAEFFLLLGEVNYNLLRTATYITLRMLDRAFSDAGIKKVMIRLRTQHMWFLDALEQMGFSQTGVRDGAISLGVDKEMFQSRKYLF